MVSITQSQRWRQQPAGATQIDRSHPMARGLVFAIVGNMPYAEEMISGNLSQPLGASTAKTFSTGVGLYSPSNVGNGWYANYDPNIFRTIGNEFTIACEFAAESIGDTSHLVSAPWWGDSSFSSPKVSFCLRRITTTSTMMIEIGTTSATEISATFSNSLISDGQKATYIAVRSGSTASLRRDNVLMTQAGSSLTSGGNVGYNTGAHVALMNRSATSPGYGAGGGIIWAYIWNRALTDQEQQDIYYNPYEIVLPVDRTRFYMAGVIDDITGASSVTSTADQLAAAGSVSNPANPNIHEFSSEFTSEFDIVPPSTSISGSAGIVAPKDNAIAAASRTIPGRSGSAGVVAPKDIVIASGSRTIADRSGSSSSSIRAASTSSAGSRTIPTRSGSDVLRSPISTVVSAGSRTIPSRTGSAPVVSPKATLTSSGTRSVAANTGGSSLLAPSDRIATSGTSAVPERYGPSALIAPKDTAQASGTRGIPARSGSAALIAPRQNISASQNFSSSGSVSLNAPIAKSTTAASSTIPARSGSSALIAIQAKNAATASRTVPGRSGNSSLIAPKQKVSSVAVDASATKVGVFLSSTCADLMLVALGQSLNSGFVRIYSGPEPSTATSTLSGNALLAELRFGATAFAPPVPIGSSRVMTANLMTGDLNADNDGVATFFRAFKSDSETIIWQGSAGDNKELILTGSGSNAYNIVKGGPVNVSSLTVAISLF